MLSWFLIGVMTNEINFPDSANIRAQILERNYKSKFPYHKLVEITNSKNKDKIVSLLFIRSN